MCVCISPLLEKRNSVGDAGRSQSRSHTEKFRDELSFEQQRRLQSALPGFTQVTDASRNTGTFDSIVPLETS